MSTTNPTQKQHFVPQFYLKNFSDNKGTLQILNIERNRIGSPRPYQGVGYEYYYYALQTGVPDSISQEIEEWLKPTEDFIARELPRIISRIENYEQIVDEDRYVLAVLMSMLWVRAPGMRNQLRGMNQDMLEQMQRIRGDDNLDALRSKDNMQHLQFMVGSMGFGGPGFANMFFGMKWKIYLARGTQRFITTDSPIVEKWLPPKGFYGTSFLGRDKYFALTPKILIKLTYPRGATKIKREALFQDQDDKARSLNIILMSGAQEFGYSGEREFLDQLLAGRANPGMLEREYIDKYVVPWDEYHQKKKEDLLDDSGV